METEAGRPHVEFRVDPSSYRHWKLAFDGAVATLMMDVAEDGGIAPGYELKLNSYDLGVDIELYDAVQRLRFEHPEVRAVVVSSAKDRVFCAGANIRMLAGATHSWKVNFCKFTNETRNAIEDATTYSGQVYVAALNGTASGGGYELALACDRILLVDDKSSTVSLPELPLLAVLPGTGGLTRVVEKRHVRRDRADYFSTKPEGIGGKRAVEWGLVDELLPRHRWAEAVAERAAEMADGSPRPRGHTGIALRRLHKSRTSTEISYRYVNARIDTGSGAVDITIRGPEDEPPRDAAEIHSRGDALWSLAMTRELDDLILDLRTNEPDSGTWVIRSEGDAERVLAHDDALLSQAGDWLVDEIVHYMKRTLKRFDVTSRSIMAIAEPGSCFAGSLLELVLLADRSFQLDGTLDESDLPAPSIRLGPMNFGPLPMGNGLTRLHTRFLGDAAARAAIEARTGEPLLAPDAGALGIVTFTPDDIDWSEEIRIAIEERASFSPDALTGLEANLRFAGPETIETKIFGRLSAWQNWIFQRPNAAGPEGALRKYGTGQRAAFDKARA